MNILNRITESVKVQNQSVDPNITKLTDEQWCDTVVASLNAKDRKIGTLLLPAFPQEKITKLTTADGATEGMLRAGFRLYTHIKEACVRQGKPLNDKCKILDFGCGWGRIARFFLKDVSKQNIYGVEAVSVLAKACSNTFRSKNFHAISQSGNLPFKSETFDVVFANSVFSHLDEKLNIHWASELSRVLRPDGFAFLTIIDENKFEGMAASSSEWFNSLGFDSTETLDSLTKGEFVWRSTKRTGELEGYGLAVIPVQWIKSQWKSHFELLEVIENYSQTVLVLKKA